MDPRALPLTTIFYPIETVLKCLFIFMSIFQLPFTMMVAFAASLIGLLRVCKIPQFNKQYLGRAFMNNHGQNLLYIGFGSMGSINFLYLSPIILFFVFGIAQYVNLKMSTSAFANIANIIRSNRSIIMQTKTYLQFLFLAYAIITLPFFFMDRIIKVMLMGQFLIIKFKVNPQFRLTCTKLNNWITTKTSSIPAVQSLYCKVVTYIYNFASQDMPRAQ